MLGNIDPGSQTETIGHIVQIVLTPVFLLSGIATLLGVFSNRLARVADRVHQLNQDNLLGSLSVSSLPACITVLSHWTVRWCSVPWQRRPRVHRHLRSSLAL